MAILYFNLDTGRVFSANQVTGDEGVARGVAVKVTDAPDGVEQWRLTWDGSKVVTFAEGKDEAGAQKDKEEAAAAQAAADKKKMEDEVAARSA